MNDYDDFYAALTLTPLAPWGEELRQRIEREINPAAHGDMPRWLETLRQLPHLAADEVLLDSDSVTVTPSADAATREILVEDLCEFHPWRKGPFTIHGVQIDTEWRSDLKWNRLKEQIQPLQGRLVLDVGCGNGYHCWRMVGAGARLVVGIDPTLLYVMQFLAIKHFLGKWPVHLLPLALEEMPQNTRAFDSVFSMGVLYHRRSPFDHLAELRGALRPGGELVLETLVIEGGDNAVLVPEGRYAKMKNVWFIPSPTTLVSWLRRAGFLNVRVIDVAPTTSEEQRTTDWMRFESFADYLDPLDPARTIEGYPAPRRAIVLAEAP
ncbi:MAG TPA: tRNA 5-methoxyuridine(34)/uridine 5-oxyacetic acid(34) synthase CmoB [Gammaproteobacteria bacterium]